MKKRRARILLVEDSHSDQIIIKRALEDGRIGCDLTITENGKEALEILRNISTHEDTLENFPDLIMMDINMPIMNGKETLQAIRGDDKLRHLPVIMLTTSNSDKDVLESYQLGVNAFLAKPVDNLSFLETMRQVGNFWFEIVVLPPKSPRYCPQGRPI